MLGFCLAECEKLLTAGVLVGFPPETIRTRVERQAGGPGIPKELSTFGQLSGSLEFNPFTKLEIVPNDFPFPDPKECGVALSLKLAGIHSFIKQYGYQQARAALNLDRNAKRLFDDYKQYLESSRAST